jgi:hypothetical protein
MRAIAKITLAIGILCLFAFAQSKPKAAVYIMGNPEGRDALRMAVNNFLVKSQKYQMIAVDALDVVAKEQSRQKSGSVSDSDIALLGRDAGAQYVCVVERAELDGISYVATRIVSVQSKVAELADMTELPRGGKIIDLIEWQIGSMLGMPVGPRPKAAASAQATYAQPVSANQAQTQPTVTIQGTIVPGGSLAQKLAWLQKGADSHETYIIEVKADESIEPYTFEFRGAIDITVVLRGVGGNRTIKLKSHGTMFTINQNVTFVLDNNVTLQGHSGNNGPMIYIDGGTFKMIGGAISGNTASYYGGGVYVSNGTFEMTGGTISGNTASEGGGVYVRSRTFTMSSGTITGNIARKNGGGVYLYYGATFSKTGGIITGYKSDPSNGNAVKDEEGDILGRNGHAIYRSEGKRRETTTGPSEKFSKDGSGAWDDAVGSAPRAAPPSVILSN